MSLYHVFVQVIIIYIVYTALYTMYYVYRIFILVAGNCQVHRDKWWKWKRTKYLSFLGRNLDSSGHFDSFQEKADKSSLNL